MSGAVSAMGILPPLFALVFNPVGNMHPGPVLDWWHTRIGTANAVWNMYAAGIIAMVRVIVPPTASMRRCWMQLCKSYVETMWEQYAVELKQLAKMQKICALMKTVLNAHILSLQEKVQRLEQEIDTIVMEKVFVKV